MTVCSLAPREPDAPMTDVSTDVPAISPPRRGLRHLMREPIANICLLFIVLQVVCITASLIFPDEFRYVSSTNVGLLMRAIPILGIISLGVGILMITGEYDLSVGSVYTLAGYVTAIIFTAGYPVWFALGAAVVIGIAIGVVNGLITVRAAIPSFITTMGAMLVVRGIVRWLSELGSVSFRPPPEVSAIFTGAVLGVEAPFIWFMVMAVLAYTLLHRSKLGNHMFLVGGNERTAIAVGIESRKIKIIAFALSGFAASLAGIISIARVGTATPAQGTGLELRAIAVCVIGGLFLSGGRGTVLGIVIGACLLYMVEDVLLLLRAPGFYLDVFVGAILVVAVVVNTWMTRRSSK
jgi:ribose/xylose/arabinose/galactoside ABC-type transport system permease subunit